MSRARGGFDEVIQPLVSVIFAPPVRNYRARVGGARRARCAGWGAASAAAAVGARRAGRCARGSRAGALKSPAGAIGR